MQKQLKNNLITTFVELGLEVCGGDVRFGLFVTICDPVVSALLIHGRREPFSQAALPSRIDWTACC
jgi:hypothetical protein